MENLIKVMENIIGILPEDVIKEYREYFDIVTARAVAALNILAEICVPFVKLNGVFIALKGSSYQEEIDTAGLAFSKLKAKYSSKTLPLFVGNDFDHSLDSCKTGDCSNNHSSVLWRRKCALHNLRY